MDINPGQIAIFYVAFLMALCFHEFAHGFVAKLRGDDTAEVMGRLTMNPMAHIDWVGTVIFPLLALSGVIPFLFGWAKPVPVNPRNLKDQKNDMFLVAIAGPASNVLLALIGVILYGVLERGDFGVGHSAFTREGLNVFIIFNLFLAIFNMIPIHPLDGGKVLARFLPYKANRWLEDNQMMLNIGLLILFVTGFFRYLAYPVYLLDAGLRYLFV
tara:strand:- start:145872 stop:146513 length:642 start_codon:yes stop_codon:yes gene_type:complete